MRDLVKRLRDVYQPGTLGLAAADRIAALEARCRDNQDAHNIVTLIDERMGKGWTRSLASALFPGAPIAADKKYVFGGPHDTAAATTLTAPETFGEHGWTCASAKHLDMVTGNTGTMCRVCGEPHYATENRSAKP